MSESGGDLVNGVIEVAPGIVIDDRLRIRGLKFLEQRLGKSFTEFAEEWGTNMGIDAMCPILVALLIQRNPDMPIEKAEQIVDDIDVSLIGKITGQLKLFDTEPKNSQPPNLVEAKAE